jgi:hypothetical protein
VGVRPTVKKSVTIEPEVLERLNADRLDNLSAAVNESLRLLAALDSQQALVDTWEAEHGPFTDEELRPYLEVAIRAQVDNTLRVLRRAGPTSAA